MPAKVSKYKAVPTNGYASKKEAKVAADLKYREMAGEISDLREQVPFVIAEGRNKVRPVTYIADFCYTEWVGKDTDGTRIGVAVVADAKGFKTAVYQLKKRLLYLLMGITITEL